MAWDCGNYYDYLFDRTPHYADDILRDWYPNDDAWIGQVKAETWDAFTGTEHVRDKLHVGYPDLSQAWTVFDTESAGCVDGACSPPEIPVGWGSTRTTFNRERISYTTNLLCFDQIDTRAKAKNQMAYIVAGLKDITKMVQSDYLRRNAIMKTDRIYIAGSGLTSIAVVDSMFGGAANTIDIGGAGNLPASQLTMPYLQRFYEGLQLKGYFKSKYVPQGIFKLITDIITAQQLTSGNPALVTNYRFTDFQVGGQLFKYGMGTGVGNFGIQFDEYPARYYWDNVNLVLRRVWPYTNQSATIGIKPVLSEHYLNAPYEFSFIWHPEAMVRYVPKLESVNPEMPFLTRDLAGKWMFQGGTRDRGALSVRDPITGTTCVVDNKRGNQGLFWADFENGIEMKYPEFVRVILHAREPGCVTNIPACSTPPGYIVQSHSDFNPVCADG